MGVTPQGRKFVLQCADPFHDYDMDLVGMPDSTGGRSYINNIRREIPVTATGLGLGANDTWDAHIATMPQVFKANVGCDSGEVNQFGLISLPGPLHNPPPVESPLVACCVKTGTATFDPTVAGAIYTGVPVPELIQLQERSRVVGWAYEVWNTTAEIYQQGSVTDYRIDAPATLCGDFWDATAGAAGMVSITTMEADLPPTTQAAAKQINGVTRKASEGSLVTCTRDRYDSKITAGQNMGLVLRDRGSYTIATGKTQCFVNPANAVVIDNQDLPLCFDTEYNRSGSYYSGLSPSTSLLVVLHMFIEVFPTPGDIAMGITSPSPPLDDRAFEALSIIQTKLLPGYPVRENAAGDFFRKVYNGLKTGVRDVRMISRMLSGAPGVVGAAAKAVNQAAIGALQIDSAANQVVDLVRRKKKKKKAAPKKKIKND